MGHETTPDAGTAHLLGVKKTLRRLYAPTQERNEAIDQALVSLAGLERRLRGAERHETVLAPAA